MCYNAIAKANRKGAFIVEYQNLYELWLKEVDDPILLAELESVRGDDEAIQDRFYKDLEFGTAGLRGVIGAGTNRMNVYTVGRATQGFSEYLKTVDKTPSVAIGYDSRNCSELFSKTAACVFAANGVKVWLYPELAPTPMVSFAIRYHKCTGGVVVTASHNPAEYNGYKAYGPDGCQLSGDASACVSDAVEKVDMFSEIRSVDFDTALNDGMIEYIGQGNYESYYENVLSQSIDPAVVASTDLKVIYTPIHGTGNKPVREVLKRIGIKDVIVVKEQELPDGNFPTAPYPNPEIRQPFECALKMADAYKPDLLLGTDPDADRVGIAVPDGEEYRLLTGNEVGAMLLNYVLSRRTALGTLPKDPVAVKSIVSTSICDKIAADYGCEMRSVLTGFKYIGGVIAELEAAGQSDRYVFGFEESYGYLNGTHVRDKDAVVASMMICEMAAYYKSQGMTLMQVLNGIYAKYGLYLHKTVSYTFSGAKGMAKMADIMLRLRTDAPKSIGGYCVESISDYEASVTTDCRTGEKAEILLPKADVVIFSLEGGNSVIVRPSGTEPKIKVYLTAVADSNEQANAVKDRLAAEMDEYLK